MQLDRPFDLHVRQAARTPDADLEIFFRRVASDNRCPQGAQCITAGEAVLTFEGRIAKGPVESFEAGLPAGVTQPDSIPKRLYDGYRIQVLRLEPYPVAGAPVDTGAYVATLKIERR